MRLTRLGLMPIIVLVALPLLIFISNLSLPVLNVPYLLLVLNFFFIAISNILVAVISARSFLKYGALNVLLLSSALVISGLASLIYGWAWIVSVNYGVAIQDISLFMASGLQVMSAIVTLTATSSSQSSNRKLALAAAYTVTLAFLAFLTAIALFDLLPPFFMASGPTLLRQAFLIMSIFFLTLSGSLFLWLYVKIRTESLYWYSLALALFAVSLFSFIFQIQNGDIYNWLGRIAQYIAGFYFLMAIVRLRVSLAPNNGFTEKWAEAFGADRKQLSTLFSNMLNGFAYCKIIADNTGKPTDYVYLDVNDAFERITNISKEKVIGKKASEVFPGIEKDPANWINLYGRVALSREPLNFERYFLATQKWLKISLYSPKKGYFVQIFEDITQRKVAEEKLEEYMKNLERTIEERTKQLKDAERLATIGATAGMVGHDIRNPLQSMMSSLYLTEKELANLPDSEEKKNVIAELAVIREQILYVDKIVRDLQDFARPINPVPVEVKINELISSSLSTLTIPDIIETSVWSDGQIDKLKVDPVLFKRIIVNLVTNAIQAMPNGGKLSIKSYKKDDKAVIMVEDTGVGIPDEVKPKLFTPLFTTKAKGQGFGLAVVKRLIEILGGTISFESEIGRGTTFVVKLPAE